MSQISRRQAVGAVLGGAGAIGMGGSALASGVLSSEQLGWDEDKREYTLPPLPYAPSALAPHIDEQTMLIHHGKHHAGYVRGLNNALAKLSEINDGDADASLIKHWSRELSFHGSGHVNHTMFWSGMAPAGQGGGGEPQGALGEQIVRDFCSFAQCRTMFKAAAKAVEGSGWGWLVYCPISSKLLIIQGEKQQDMMMTGVVPLLGVDVWEHAYYLKYQNRRADYLDAFMNVVNWGEIGRRFEKARS